MVVEGVPYCSDVVSDSAQGKKQAECSQVPPRLERAFNQGWRLRRVAAAPPSETQMSGKQRTSIHGG